jgi:Zn-dependent protease with chaperone function
MRLTVIPFLIFTALCYCLSMHAQTAPFHYVSLKDNDADIQKFSNALTQQYNEDVKGLTGENKKEVAEIYKSRYQEILDDIKNKDIVSASPANEYLQSILNKIIQKNPQLSGLKIRAAFARDYWPNASSIGEGTLLFNIGLFNRLQNESQVCFVLCHELAHLYLNHGNASIAKYVSTMHSAEFQRQLKDIKNSEYQKSAKFESLTKNYLFTSKRHVREYEKQADSLGLEFMKNTQFDVRESLTCLALLDSVDNDKYNVKLPLEKIFNSDKYPFQSSWVSEGNNFFSAMAKMDDSANAAITDSLKTHPDCVKRIAFLSEAVAKYYNNSQQINLVSDSTFNQLKRIFDYEIIDYCFNNDKVSKSLFYTLQMMQFFPDDVYLVTNTGRCLNKIYAAQKNHSLNFIVDLPSPYQEEKYNSFLKFIERLRLSDVAGIDYYFMEQNKMRFASDADFVDQEKISAVNFTN